MDTSCNCTRLRLLLHRPHSSHLTRAGHSNTLVAEKGRLEGEVAGMAQAREGSSARAAELEQQLAAACGELE